MRGARGEGGRAPARTACSSPSGAWAALGLFDRVTITEMDPDSPLRRSVVVRAEEAPLTSVSYGIGYAEQDYLRGSVEVTRRNLFGMDRRLSVFARASFRGFRMLGTFREP